MKKRLSPRTIKALKPGKDGLRHGAVIMDDLTPNLGVRILGTAERPQHTFVLVTRFPGRTQPTRAALATFDRRDDEAAAASLRAARRKAIDWLAQIEQGRDPRLEEARQREAKIREQATVFGAIAEDFIREKLPSERRGADVEREIRKEFRSWWPRPITDITEEDVIRVIRAKAKTAPAAARNILGNLKRVFQWAIDQRTYGLKVNPCTSIKPVAIIGEKIARERVLDNVELRAFWLAADSLPYPQGPMFKLLALTGCRLAGVSDARWSEFSPVVRDAIRRRGDDPVDWSQFSTDDLWWVIPSDRVKGRNGRARSFMVPLTVEMLKILEGLPSFAGGDYLFSRNFGETPAVVSTEIKGDLDAKMLDALRQLAQQRGEDPDGVELKPWVSHDLRRVVRSALSRLRVPQEHAEAVLGHTRGGIQGVYDRHDFFAEKRDALQRWNDDLRRIVNSSPTRSNVIALRA